MIIPESDQDLKIIIERVNYLYPSFVITGYTKQGDEYLIHIEHNVNIPGSALDQRWKVEKGQAAFIEGISGNKVQKRNRGRR